MIDHLLGRPSLHWKRAQVILVLGFWLWRLFQGEPHGPRLLWLRRINRWLQKRYTPWQIIVASMSMLYAARNADSILGLGSPEPLARMYSPSYYRATWISTAFDAGFATAMHIRPKFLKDFISMVCTGYYLVYAREADEKLRRFRAVCTVEMLRTTWEKTSNPYIRFISYFDRPRLPIVRTITLSRPPGSVYKKPMTLRLFYARSEKELAWATELIFDMPGGGFISMSSEHHEERLRRWAIRTGKPVLALDYGKAPEYPYPWAIDEAFDAYRVLADSKGKAIGMSGRALNVILSGDSAGGNIIATVMYRILESKSPTPILRPTALVFAYPALDFNITSWMSPSHLRVLRSEQLNTTSASSLNVRRLVDQKDHLSHRSPLTVVPEDSRKRRGMKRQKSWSAQVIEKIKAPLSPATSMQNARKGPARQGLSWGRPPSSGTAHSFVDDGASTPTPDTSFKARPSAFRARLANRVSELGGLAVDTSSAGTPARQVSDDEKEAKSDDGYASEEEQDKPLSARFMYSPDVASVEVVLRGKEEMKDGSVEIIDKKKVPVPIGTRLTMTSRTALFHDRIISPSMMRAMAILYIGPKQNPDFETDYLISPILAPLSLLKEFPPCLFICGEKDPFVDDTIIFSGRICEAKRQRRSEVRFTGPSKHGESLRMTNNDAAERERQRLLNESEEDWVDVRLLAGIGHGILQMTALMSESVQVINEMADWIGDAFATHATASTPPVAASTSSRRPSPPHGSTLPGRSGRPLPVTLHSSAHKTSPTAITSPRRPDLGVSSKKMTSNDLINPLWSETDTEPESPVSFLTMRTKTRSPPPQESSSTGDHQRTSSNETARRRQSSSRGDKPAVPDASDGVATPSIFEPSFGRGGVAGATSGTGTPSSGGGALLNAAEIMRRRQADVVFGMGESVEMGDDDADDHRAPPSPSPAPLTDDSLMNANGV